MASSQLRVSNTLARSLRLTNRSFTTSARRFEAAVPASSNASAAVTEESAPKELTQAPNRTGVWSRSQKPRVQAMTGPRFEQTEFAHQASLNPKPNRVGGIGRSC
jgi:NADH dehydrogenase (ubiquinone) Fe-S protein 6